MILNGHLATEINGKLPPCADIISMASSNLLHYKLNIYKTCISKCGINLKVSINCLYFAYIAPHLPPQNGKKLIDK